jgi:GMP synthase-like glutamine amidotransferase
MDSSVLVVQHVAPETSGRIGEALARRGVGVRTIRIDRGDAVPKDLEGAAGLVVMGGPMGVYEAARHPHLTAEIALIERALAADGPVLGVCLGSQLLATALGAKVAATGRMEIGWHDVVLEAAARTDALFAAAPARFSAFHWHGDAFELPSGGQALAASEQTPLQAFRHGARRYGILFHMETTQAIADGMIADFGHELAGAGVDSAALAAETRARLPSLGAIADAVFDRWAALVPR